MTTISPYLVEIFDDLCMVMVREDANTLVRIRAVQSAIMSEKPIKAAAFLRQINRLPSTFRPALRKRISLFIDRLKDLVQAGELPLYIDAEALKSRRQGLALSQVELAEAFDVPKEVISRWETGVRPIPHPAILALAIEALERRARLDPIH